MKEAFSGIFNFVYLIAFLLIVSGILLFIVGYAKAFRMKNYIILSIENFEGRESCFSSRSSDDSCSGIISQKAKSLGYAPNITSCPSGFSKASSGLFCYLGLGSKEGSERHKKFRVVTQIDLNIPIFRDIFTKEFFQVTGDTKYMK